MKSRHTSLVLAAIAAVTIATQASAATIYVTLTGGTTKFGRFDTISGAFTPIATPGVTLGQNLEGLTWDGALGAFRVVRTDGLTSTLETITTSGSVSSSGPTLVGDSYIGIATTGSGAPLYTFRNSVGVTFELGTTNPSTGAWTTVSGAYSGFPPDSFPPQAGVIAYYGETLYAAGFTSDGNIFGRFNTSTGLFTQIGSANNAFYTMAMSSDGTGIYGVTVQGSAPGIYSVNSVTGVPTLLTSLAGFAAENALLAAGMAASPVPEPASLGMVGVGIASACGWWCRGRRKRA